MARRPSAPTAIRAAGASLAFLHALVFGGCSGPASGDPDAAPPAPDAAPRDAGSDAGAEVPPDAGSDPDGGVSLDASSGLDAATATDGGTTPTGSEWLTYFAGPRADQIRDVAIDGSGNVYVAGGADSAGGFPTTPGAYDRTPNGNYDVFVAKFDPDGALLWSTLIGGPNYDRAYAIEVDAAGNVWVGGRAGAGFPTTSGVVQEAFGGDTSPNPAYGAQDPFVLRLSADGSSLIWSTYFGGADSAICRDIAIDAAGDVYLALVQEGVQPHITAGSFGAARPTGKNAALAKLSADGTTVIYAGYVGGSGDDGNTPTVRVDGSGNAYLLTISSATDAPTTAGAYRRTPAGGTDAYLVKVSPDGSTLLFGTFLGGTGNESIETHHLALDGAGNAYLAVGTQSTDAPTTAGAISSSRSGPGDMYVAAVSADGSSLLAATYLGGSGGEFPQGVGVDASGRVFLTGESNSTDFPTTSGSFQPARGGAYDGVAVVLSNDLTRVDYASYVGGNLGDSTRCVAVGAAGEIVVAGQSASVDLPTTSGAYAGSYAGGPSDGMIGRFIP